MSRASNPESMQPAVHGPTRTAPPMMSPKYPIQGRYRAYILFGACSFAFVLSSLLLLRTVWAIGNGSAAYARVLESFENPIYILYHVVALVAFVYTGWRFFIKLFAKSQPPRIGPLKPPPPAAIPPMLIAAWVAATAGVLAVAWGIFP